MSDPGTAGGKRPLSSCGPWDTAERGCRLSAGMVRTCMHRRGMPGGVLPSCKANMQEYRMYFGIFSCGRAAKGLAG